MVWWGNCEGNHYSDKKNHCCLTIQFWAVDFSEELQPSHVPWNLNDTWACSSMWNDLKTSLRFNLTYQSHIGLTVIKRQANQLLNKFSRRRWNKNKQSAIIFLSSSSEPVSLLYVCDWLGLKFEAHLEKIARAHIWKDWFESVTVYLACPLVFSGYFLPLLSCPIRPI